jgi:hypothetical protein
VPTETRIHTNVNENIVNKEDFIIILVIIVFSKESSKRTPRKATDTKTTQEFKEKCGAVKSRPG